MGFAVSPESYDRFMGRYSAPLAPLLADLAGVHEGQRAIDVGCGTGALTDELVRRLGAVSVSAVEPSVAIAAKIKERHPDVDLREAPAEEIPFADGTFDVALAQLVVHFMADPVAGLHEMARVTKPGGVVAACVWDHEGGGGPLSLYWDAAQSLDPDAPGESKLAGARGGHLTALFEEAGLTNVEETSLAVTVEHPTFEEWWEPFALAVGPAGQYLVGLDAPRRAQLEQRLRGVLGAGPFTVNASAWAARGVVS